VKFSAKDQEQFNRIAKGIDFGCTLKDQRFLVALVQRFLRSQGDSAKQPEGSGLSPSPAPHESLSSAGKPARPRKRRIR